MNRFVDAYHIHPAAALPDNPDPATRAQAVDNERRSQVIAGLRNLATLLDENPELPTPYSVTAQAGPLGGDWDDQRQIVADAAAVLGEPLDRDTDTRVTVRARLNTLPTVEYVVHADRLASAEDGTR